MAAHVPRRHVQRSRCELLHHLPRGVRVSLCRVAVRCAVRGGQVLPGGVDGLRSVRRWLRVHARVHVACPSSVHLCSRSIQSRRLARVSVLQSWLRVPVAWIHERHRGSVCCGAVLLFRLRDVQQLQCWLRVSCWFDEWNANSVRVPSGSIQSVGRRFVHQLHGRLCVSFRVNVYDTGGCDLSVWTLQSVWRCVVHQLQCGLRVPVAWIHERDRGSVSCRRLQCVGRDVMQQLYRWQVRCDTGDAERLVQWHVSPWSILARRLDGVSQLQRRLRVSRLRLYFVDCEGVSGGAVL